MNVMSRSLTSRSSRGPRRPGARETAAQRATPTTAQAAATMKQSLRGGSFRPPGAFAPHFTQYRVPSLSSAPHFWQNMCAPFL